MEPLRWAVLFGLFAGAFRALHYVSLRLTSDDFLWTSDVVVWLSPPGHALVFLVPGAALAFIVLVVGRPIPRRPLTWIFAALAIFALLLRFTMIHPVASLALAIGAGHQISRLIRDSTGRAMKVLHWGAAGIVMATVCTALAMSLASRLTDRRIVGALPSAPPGSPNVLLIVLDAVRAANMSVYGYAAPTTPNLERFAADGVVFERAVASTSWTLPSIATLLTGEYPTVLSADWLEPLDDRSPIVTEVLRARGFHTGVFSANPHYLTPETGLGRGVIHFDGLQPSLLEALFTVSLVQSKVVKDVHAALTRGSVAAAMRALLGFEWLRPSETRAHERKAASDLTDDFLHWESTNRGRPWFALLNYFDAHAPYKPRPPFDTAFGDAGLVAQYDGAIATIDDELGRLFAALAERRVLDATIVVVTADHGELLGEHGFEHGNHLYLHLIHVPLLVRAPGRVPADVRVARTVSLRDVAATILDLVQADEPAAARVSGTSLRPLWLDGSLLEPSPAIAALTKMERRQDEAAMQWVLTSVVDDTLHYIRNRAGAELLFDISDDPEEWNNLIASEAGREAARRLRARLDSALRVSR